MKDIEFSFVRVAGSKEYDEGCRVWASRHYVTIEFDSDYYISKRINAKNWRKRAGKIISKLPDSTTIEWLERNGWNVSNDVKRAAKRRIY